MSKRPDGNPLICSNEECTGDVACAECSAEFDSTKSQTDNTELDEIKKTVWECIRYNKFNLSDTEAVGVIMQAVEAKLQEQDIKSRIDELNILTPVAESWVARHYSYLGVNYVNDRLTQLSKKGAEFDPYHSIGTVHNYAVEETAKLRSKA